MLKHFSIQITQPSDGNWGSRDTLANGTEVWNGIVGQLAFGEVDMSGATLTISEERSKAVDFSISVLEDVTSLYLLNPSTLGKNRRDVNLMVFITVFTTAAWVGILLITFTGAFVYSVILLAKRGTGRVLPRNALLNFAEGSRFILLSLIQKSSFEETDCFKFLSWKLLGLSTSAVSFVLFACYGADLTAKMTAGSSGPSLKSMQDLLDLDYKLHMVKGTVFYDLFKHSKPGSVMRELFDNNLETMESSSFLEQQLQRQSKAAFLASDFAFLGNKELLFLRNFDDTIVSQLAFGYQKDSDLTKLFDYHLTKIIQSGMLQKIFFKWVSGAEPENREHRIFQEEATVLGYENLSFPMLLILGGILSGTCIFAAENLCVRRKRILKNVEYFSAGVNAFLANAYYKE